MDKKILKYSLRDFQDIVSILYLHKDFTNDLLTLGLGLCEEAGEVGKAINVDYNPKFKPSKKVEHNLLSHELCDLLVYAFGIANSVNIDLEKEFDYYLQLKLME